MRLQVFLSQAGIASRRNVLRILEEGKVRVNGEVVRISSYPIFPDKDQVTVDEREVKLAAKRLYFMFHKPKGVITTVQDTHGRKTVLDFFKDVRARLYPVGRLDQDTTGLLLVTDDGWLTHRLIHPRYGVEKIYEAVLDGELSEAEAKRVEGGVIVEGVRTSPCRVKVLNVASRRSRIEITLHEGRKRQIRQMFKTIGFPVLDLHRKRYGPLVLRDLRPGEKRALSEEEVKALKEVAQASSVSHRMPERGRFRPRSEQRRPPYPGGDKRPPLKPTAQ